MKILVRPQTNEVLMIKTKFLLIVSLDSVSLFLKKRLSLDLILDIIMDTLSPTC